MASHDPPPTCGDSEYSWAGGMFPNPAVDYEQGRTVFNFEGHRTRDDQVRDMIAEKRSNTQDDSETLEQMTTALGNPDRYGGHPPIVQQSPQVLPPDPQLEPVAIFEREE